MENLWGLTVVPRPQPEPRIIRIGLVMLLVRGLPIGHLERPLVQQRQDVLQQVNVGNDLFGVHAVVSISDVRRHVTDSGLHRLHMQ
jgi:hypothetical protein